MVTLWTAFGNQFLAFAIMSIVGFGIVFLIGIFNLTMSWFAMPELVFPLYIVSVPFTQFIVNFK